MNERDALNLYYNLPLLPHVIASQADEESKEDHEQLNIVRSNKRQRVSAEFSIDGIGKSTSDSVTVDKSISCLFFMSD